MASDLLLVASAVGLAGSILPLLAKVIQGWVQSKHSSITITVNDRKIDISNIDAQSANAIVKILQTNTKKDPPVSEVSKDRPEEG